ncbi:MAG: M23 family metallopeptidase [Candidatus Dormibacteraeota bacterium]|nr:M23 family metallopeptidase [Candidatus Dormibacteraeota bacterium]
MALPAAAAHLLAARSVRRVLGCGCLCLIVLIAMPVLVLFSIVNGLIPGDAGTGISQIDATAGVVVGGAEPLTPGHFRVSQGFGCTALSAEPRPPRGYTCPPDAAHHGFVWFHTGIDLAAAAGLPVFAVAPGSIHVVESTAGFGIHILLTPPAQQGPPVTYLYGHLSEVAVPDGDVVRAGDPIGYVGTTGNSSGPHLHIEVDVGGAPVNPCASFPTGYLVPAGVAAAGCLAWAM